MYDFSYKTSTAAKPLRIGFNKIDGFIKNHDKMRYLVLFDYTQPGRDVPGTSHEDPGHLEDLQGTLRGPTQKLVI